MKKNIAMRLASGLMLSCLLSTCVISGTFAKYTTSDTDNDSARVAKWGVEVTVTSEAFNTTYAKDDVNTEIATTVSSSVDVVAPGTSGTLVEVDIEGTPEVAVRVTKEATFALTGNWVIDHDNNAETAEVFYCPLTVAGVNGLNYTNADLFATAVIAAIEGEVVEYAVGGTLSNSDATFTWAWLISGATGDGEIHQTNVADTVLGNAAVDADLGISFSLTVTVEQID